MAEKPIDLEAVRQADAKLEKALEDYPELQEHNPERQQAYTEWLPVLDQEAPHHG